MIHFDIDNCVESFAKNNERPTKSFAELLKTNLKISESTTTTVPAVKKNKKKSKKDIKSPIKKQSSSLPSPPNEKTETTKVESPKKPVAAPLPLVNVWAVRMAEKEKTVSKVDQVDEEDFTQNDVQETPSKDLDLAVPSKKEDICLEDVDSSPEGSTVEEQSTPGLKMKNGTLSPASSTSSTPFSHNNTKKNFKNKGNRVNTYNTKNQRGNYPFNQNLMPHPQQMGMMYPSPTASSVSPVLSPLISPLGSPVLMDKDTLKACVLAQIEYYFSVENLCKDIFFRKQMDSEGYVNLDTIANFNRVKSLTQEMDLIVEALNDSKVVQLMDNCKIRRLENWEQWVIDGK